MFRRPTKRRRLFHAAASRLRQGQWVMETQDTNTIPPFSVSRWSLIAHSPALDLGAKGDRKETQA